MSPRDATTGLGMSVRLERGAVDTSWERDNPYVSRASDSSLTNIAPLPRTLENGMARVVSIFT